MSTKRPDSWGHSPGRGCECASCVKRRQYARDRYHEKYKNVPRNRATGKPVTASSLTTRNTEASGNEPRFFDDRSSGEVAVVHWLPDANQTGMRAWGCPECHAWFYWSVDEQKWTTAA